MTLSPTIKNNLWPLLLIAGGLAIVTLSRPFIHVIQEALGDAFVCAITASTWLTLLAWLWVMIEKRSASRRLTRRWMVVIGLCAIYAMPFKMSDYIYTAIESISLLGGLLVIVGAAHSALAAPVLAGFNRLIERTDAIPSWLFGWMMFFIFLGTTVFLSWYCFSFIPAYPDSLGQYVHGRYISMGHIAWPAHPFPMFFFTPMSIKDPMTWYSQYQPLHVLILGLGHYLRAPWMVNPTEGALLVVVIYALARRVFDEGTARIAALLALFCPFILFISSEYMNHATAALFSALFLLCYIEMLESPKGKNDSRRCLFGLAAGYAIGGVFLSRPLTAVGISGVFILYSLWLLWKEPKTYFHPLFIMGLAALSCVAFQGIWNLATTNTLWEFPYGHYSLDNIPGFNNKYTIIDAFYKMTLEWAFMNRALFEWPIPCTLFLMLACLMPVKKRYARLLLATLFLYTFANMGNRFFNMVWGPRYLYELSPIVIIFTAAGIRRLPGLMKLWGIHQPRDVLKGLAAALVLTAYITGWAYRMPVLMGMYSNYYFDNHPDFYYSMINQAEKPALVFIEIYPPLADKKKDNHDKKYTWVTHDNPPRDEQQVIFAMDLGIEKDRKLIDYYPTRKAYIERQGKLYPIDKSTYTSDAPPVQEQQE